MGHNAPNGYRGALTPEQALEGMNAATRNARRLAADARLLLDAGRYPSAAAIAALSVEESGKVSVLRSLAVTSDPAELDREWRNFRESKAKGGLWNLPELLARNAQESSELRQVIERDPERNAILDSVKRIGFHADCFGEGKWCEPGAMVEQELAESMVAIAELLAQNKLHSKREVELWVQHLGPAMRSRDLPGALLRWMEAMAAEGFSQMGAEDRAKLVLGETCAEAWTDRTARKH
jgi:AbiV family abortive infection protein